MNVWLTPIDLDLVNSLSKNNMLEHLGIKFTEIGEDYLVATMPVDHRTKQPFGIMHGGASCVLAETIASTAANFCIDYHHFYCVGLDISTNHIKSVSSGFVTGTAKPIHLGKTTQVWGVDIKNEENKLISSTRMTMIILKR